MMSLISKSSRLELVLAVGLDKYIENGIILYRNVHLLLVFLAKTEVGIKPEGTRLTFNLQSRSEFLEASIMKLSYRGIKYNQELVATSDVAVEKTAGKYRGKDCQISRVSPRHRKSQDLPRAYRGVHY